MKPAPKIIRQNTLHSGFLKLNEYDLSVPSLEAVSNKTIQLKQREVVHSSDSVTVLLYEPQKESVLLCQEFRPGVFLNKNSQDAPYIYECVSGSIEEAMSPEDTAIKETYEETGVEIQSITKIAEVYKTPGLMTEKSFLFFAEIPQTVNTGIFGVAGEEIKTFLFPLPRIKHMLKNAHIRDSATLITLQWLLLRL